MGELMRTLIEQCKVEIGIGGNCFTNDYTTYGHLLPKSLIQFVWKFCSEYNIQLNEDITGSLPLHKENDLYLMEVIAHSGYFSKGKLIHINHCRLHLYITTLSDIANGFGNYYNSTLY